MLLFADIKPLLPSKQVEYSEGRYLADEIQGEPVVGFVLKGCVAVYAVALDGREVCLNHLYPNDCFGIANLVAPGNVDTVLHCEPHTVVAYVNKEALLRLLHHDAALAMKYAMLCNAKIQFLLKRIESLTMQTSRGKIIVDILLHRDGLQMNLIGSRDDWANRLGMSRATLFRELAQLQKQGYISIKGKNLTILDLKQLQEKEKQL